MGHCQVEDLHLFRIATKPFPMLETKYLISTTSLIFLINFLSKNFFIFKKAALPLQGYYIYPGQLQLNCIDHL